MSKYLVVAGDEYGFDLGNMTDLSFNELDKAEEIYNECLEEFSCVAMYKVNNDGLEIVKMESNF
jgi:hypothetical protein